MGQLLTKRFVPSIYTFDFSFDFQSEKLSTFFYFLKFIFAFSKGDLTRIFFSGPSALIAVALAGREDSSVDFSTSWTMRCKALPKYLHQNVCYDKVSVP